MMPHLLLVAAAAFTLQTASPTTPTHDSAGQSAGAAQVAAAAGQPALAPLPVDVNTPDLLEAMNQRGKSLNGFTADVTMTDVDFSNGDQRIYTAKLIYDAKAGSIRVEFLTRDEGKGPRKYAKSYLLQDGWLTTRDYLKKEQTRMQVARPGTKINLLKLGEGPFPLPIGQEPAEVQKQFVVSRPADADPRPLARLVPQDDTRLAQKFKKIDVWVDNQTHFPTKIETTDKQESGTRRTELGNLQVNPALSPKDFVLPEIDPEWKTSEIPFED